MVTISDGPGKITVKKGTYDLEAGTLTLSAEKVQVSKGDYVKRIDLYWRTGQFGPGASTLDYVIINQAWDFYDGNPNYYGFYYEEMARYPTYYYDIPMRPQRMGYGNEPDEALAIDVALLPISGEAPEVVANIDDSYSLRDIIEFKTEVATTTLTGSFDFINENKLNLKGGSQLSFTPNGGPEQGWLVQFIIDGATMTVKPGQNLTVGGASSVEMTNLQYVSQDGSVEAWTGDMKVSTGDAWAYWGSFQRGEVTTLEEWSSAPDLKYDSKVWRLELRQHPVNIATGESQSWSIRGLAPFRPDSDNVEAWTGEGTFDTLEAAQTAFESKKAEYEGQVERSNALVLAEQEKEKIGTTIYTTTESMGRWHPDKGKTGTFTVNYTGKQNGKNQYIVKYNDILVIGTVYTATDSEAIEEAKPIINSFRNPPRPEGEGWGTWWIWLLVAGVAVGIVWLVWRRAQDAD